MKEFQRGELIKTVSGNTVEILEKLGEGGQGIVYRVKYGHEELALKWYFGKKLHEFDRFYSNIENNIKQGSPSECFLWPLELTEKRNDSFGYLMKLRPKNYKDFSHFLLAKVHFEDISALINAALSIIKGFRALHNRGYSYQDLNDGNFFVDPKTGDVLICDNDNVSPYGENLGIIGKCRYMAPEVVTGKKSPDCHTDRFSLAVILYMLLFLNHPLEGKRTMCPCLTEELECRYYGTEPVFVWDKYDDSNRPVRGVHVNEIRLWKLYPEFVRNTFERAFSTELLTGADIEHRIIEKEWLETFKKLRDMTVKHSCGSDTFYTNEDCVCVNCGEKMTKPMLLNLPKHKVVLTRGTKLYSCHTDGDTENDIATAEVVASLNDSAVLGLKNLSEIVWSAELPNGVTRTFEKGQTVKLGRKIKINFGNVKAEIE